MIELHYFAHSCFTIRTNNSTILIDPFLSGNPLAKENPASLHPQTILLSHGHSDHLGDLIEIAQASGAQVLAVNELSLWLQKQGIDKAIPAGLGGTIRFDWGSAKLVQAFHSSTIEVNGEFLPAGDPCGFLIWTAGKTIYFAGDTCLFGDMRLIGEMAQPQLDLALLPIGGHFTMGIEDAVKATRFLDPRVVIPMHYDTFPPVEADAGEFKQLVESETEARCVIVPPGGDYRLD